MGEKVKRAFRIISVIVLAIVVGLTVFTPSQELLYRRHVSQLLGDVQRIELHRSTWADMQAISSRWGRWGHYEGTCNELSCRYDIELSSALDRVAGNLPAFVWLLLRKAKVWRLCALLGDKNSMLSASFIVQDGRIVRKGVYFTLEVAPGQLKDDEYGYRLLANVVSYPRLTSWGTLHNDAERYASDPNYTATRPSGCSICMEVTLIYSDRTPPQEVKMLNFINLDCLNLGGRCSTIEDILPASKPFHLYDPASGVRPEEPRPAVDNLLRPHACNVPLWALGRDAFEIQVADVLKVYQVDGRDFGLADGADVRIVSSVTGDRSWPLGTQIKVESSAGHDPNFLAEMPVPFVAGKRFFLLTFDKPEEGERTRQSMAVEQCGVVLYSEEARLQIEQGLAMRDHLRQPELRHWPFRD